MTPLRLLELVAATWYIAFTLTSLHGPGGVFEWIREHVWHGRRGYVVSGIVNHEGSTSEKIGNKNGLLDCPICLAFWAALILSIVPDGIVVQALAIAGAAMLAHGYTGWRYNNG